MNGADRESGRPEPTTRTRAPGRCARQGPGAVLLVPRPGAPLERTGGRNQQKHTTGHAAGNGNHTELANPCTLAPQFGARPGY